MTQRIGILIIIVFAIGLVSHAQTPGQPKQLKVKGTYIHSPTMTEFPENIDSYQRQSVYSFDKKKENIGSTYKNGQTTLSIYLYPAGDGNEGRLRNQYLKAMQDMANVSKKGLHATQGYKYYKSDGYKINGFSATTPDYPKSQLTLFECGKWFFKVRITTDQLDTVAINKLEKELLDTFNPINLVKDNPLDSKANVYFERAAFRDSLLIGSAMGSAFKKLEWALENVDSLERASGFPDLYLDMHVESLKAFVDFEKRQNISNIQQFTRDYVDELNQIIDSGFLEEFILEQFSMVMIFKDRELDFDSYAKWKEQYPTKINLNERFYMLSYKAKD
ncbi:MAG: hypothetical protein KIT51_04930 [Cyclobacteriaceae bacterium]|nr:MAG: hypothetical protein KIT51_04930 [Cyclobacteriaceae bacterium]